MKLKDVKEGDFVAYIPEHLFKEALETGDQGVLIEERNLGIVTSKNDSFVFVRYVDSGETSRATKPEQLFQVTDNLAHIQIIQNSEQKLIALKAAELKRIGK